MNYEILNNETVKLCLYNWLGYGNMNGRVWFIGTEEGGGEIMWENQNEKKVSTKTLQLVLVSDGDALV